MVARSRSPDLPNMWTPLIMAALQTVSATVEARADSQPTFRPDSAAMATAYGDAATRELVRLARGRHGMIDASVFRYRATVRQRVSVGIRALRRDRLLYRRETAAAIDWRRDGPGTVKVLGARETVPMAMPGPRIPDDMEDWARALVPDPGADRLVLTPDGGGFAWHPLVDGGEAVYTYATGETTEIRLPDGTAIRLAELRVTPRQRDIRLITGSFWIELDGHAIVQAVFRPSRELDLERDLAVIDPGEEDELDDVPGLFKPIRFDLRYVTVEYGLWEMRWWMPRLVAVDGSLQMGAAQFPMSYEVAYSDYRVEADRHGLQSLPPVIRQLAGDSVSRARPFEHRIAVVIPDSAVLLESPTLPGSLYDPDALLISDDELRELGRRLGALPPTPWAPETPRITWPWEVGRGLLRYNRVEALSAGARVDWALGPAALDLTARLGVAGEPSAELGVEVPTLRGIWRLAGYHRLAAADPATRPFGLGNSLSALLFGRDDGMYFRASGAEIRRAPAPGEPRYELRLYAERQASVDRNTQFSLRRVLDAGWGFRPNIQADPATQLGVAGAFGVDRWTDPRGFRWSAWLDLTAETGDYTFLRPGLSLRTGFPLPARLLAATEVAAGTMVGSGDDPLAPGGPAQSLWQLGGPASVRGFHGGAVAGPDYVRGRAELGTAFPAARVALFGDAGWAGDADAFDTADALASVGVGASFLDGLVRMDLVRTIRPDRRWRMELHVDAMF